VGSDSDSTVGHGDIDFGAGEIERVATGDGVDALLVGGGGGGSDSGDCSFRTLFGREQRPYNVTLLDGLVAQKLFALGIQNHT
jgi:hypothetical protein